MKTGIIQTRGLGDIIIAAPIAQFLARNGHEVYWPIDSDFIKSISFAFPNIKFIPVDKSITGNNTAEYFLEYPKKLLEEIVCEKNIILYSHLTNHKFNKDYLNNYMSFDRYKYAVAGVPFSEKWNLILKRNRAREKELFNILNIRSDEKYIVMHEEGSNFKTDLSSRIKNVKDRLINITPITDNFLDWLGVLEKCSEAHLIDSVYSNIVDQLGFKIKKTFYPRSAINFTPIFKSDWIYECHNNHI